MNALRHGWFGFFMAFKDSVSHRITCVGGDLKYHLVPIPLPWKRGGGGEAGGREVTFPALLPVDEVAGRPI